MKNRETYPSEKDCSFDLITAAMASKVSGDYLIGNEMSDPSEEDEPGMFWYNPDFGLVYKLLALPLSIAEDLAKCAKRYAIPYKRREKDDKKSEMLIWVVDFSAPKYVLDEKDGRIVGEVKSETPTMERWRFFMDQLDI